MKLSEDYLYHFTKKEYIVSIIEDGFIPFFGEEIIDFDDYGEYRIRIEKFPRVCFTDLPINLIQNHKDKYGNYALGMKKEWAIKNGMNPILYVQKNSAVGTTLSLFIERIYNLHENLRKEKINPSQELILQSFVKLNDMIGRFSKQYEIDDSVPDIKVNDRLINREKGRFYDEREWRYVPYQYQVKDLNGFTASNISKKELDELSKKYTLKFNIDDIVMIVIPKDDTESESYLSSILSRKFNITQNEVISKIKILKI